MMTSHKRVSLLALAFALVVLCRPASAQDPEPAKDHPSVPRFPGMVMVNAEVTDFDGFDFDISDDGKTHRAEGKSWDFLYVLNDGARHPSRLEVIRNYANQFTARGGKLLFQNTYDATMMMPLGTGERWLHLSMPDSADRILMRIIDTAAMEQKVEFSADEMAAQAGATGKITLHGILFDTAKTDIKPESGPVLDEVAAMMKKNAALKFTIVGHTDNVGAKPANLALSKGRAASVKAALVSRGVEAARLTSDGMGDSQPVADNATEDGRAQNRRVELVKR